VEPSPRLDRRADDDELRTALCGDSCDVFPQAPRTRADNLASHAHAVRGRHRGGVVEALLQVGERAVHVRVDRQLTLDDERGDEDDLGPAVGGQAAGEIERVLGFLEIEQRHDDAPVGDRAGPAREASRPAMQEPDVGQPHRSSW
jgi:hypothetical protein